MAAQTVSPPHTASQGTKRSAEDLNATPTKRRRPYHHYHSIAHRQPSVDKAILHCQDERLFQGQLDRALATILSSAGFDSAKHDALEALRASTQEFMLHIVAQVRKSMLSSRRTQPLPQDFVLALAQDKITSTDLLPQAKLPLPPDFALPQVLGPPPNEPEAPVLDPVLGSGLNGRDETVKRKYIPKTLPAFPSRHTWQKTPVFPGRETDPRKIRERATQEGILAEQALRKLAAARKSYAPQRRGRIAKSRSAIEARKKKAWETALASVLQDDQHEQQRFVERQLAEDGMDAVFEHPKPRKIAPSEYDNGLLVNYDRKNWRKAPGSMVRT